jgi:phosphoribosylformimino-5-aminoimidazole carboxamide ribotide isomerase
MLDRYRNNLIFSVDAKNGKVAIKGWKKSLKIEAEEYIANLEQRGAKRIIYTDISKDGMMSGPNLKVLESVVRKTTMDVTASGGISDIDDIKALKRLEQYGLRSVIIGKALYEEKIDLKEAIRVGEENHSLP